MTVVRPLVLACVAVLGLVGGANSAPDRSRQNYLQFCSGCHQADGSGSPSAGIPDMRGQLGYFLHTPRGRALLVQVPGSSNSPLSDSELAQLLNWLVATFSLGQAPEPFEPFSESEVRRLRREIPAAIEDIRREVVSDLRRLGYPVR